MSNHVSDKFVTSTNMDSVFRFVPTSWKGGPFTTQRVGDVVQSRLKSAGLRFLKIACSNVGLLVVVLAYCFLGGALFRHLEIDNEREDCSERRNTFMPNRNLVIKRLMKVFEQGLDSSSTGDSVEKILNLFSKDTLKIQYDWTNCSTIGTESGEIKWSWAGSTMFAVTIITTVGESFGI